ncbi:hypothetical protein [Iodobacter sp.]|uniref:hypothetical protein n=1 Tax=Iodobacter sp. TaxID=1915058 RepID=UPI0025FF1496|nr:hypothetical protein [Iodobacter sp.]
MRNLYLRYCSYIFVYLCLILSACGGGGDSPSSSMPASPPTSVAAGLPQPSAVYISEISSSDADGSGVWIELYNSSNVNVSLNGFSVRVSGLDDSLIQYNLPRDLQIKAGGYLLLAEKGNDAQPNTDQIAYLDHFSNLALLGSNGVLELLKEGVTQDFVRFGSSKVIPQSAGLGHGDNIIVKPSYGQSLAKQAGQWVLVSFATPGGVNDVLATATDADNDGIPDSAEVPGGTFAGIDYYGMGARVAQPDIFIQIDHMKSNDPGVLPVKDALQKVVDVFKARNISVHFDSGSLYSNEFSLANFNLGGGRTSRNNEVAYHACLGVSQISDGISCASVYTYKDQNMDIRRKSVFHYLLMANSQNINGTVSSSGNAEKIGNDFIVTLGGWGLTTHSDNEKNKLINFQAATIMHELGHNLGLDHGGNDSLNYKPNYYSVMNYLYQLMGLGSDPKTTSAVERYFLAKNTNGFDWNSVCKLEAGPCSRDFRMDYSDGSGAKLDENNLSESAMIGRGSYGAFADWNVDQQLNRSSYALDLNDDGSKTVLYDYNDWANLTLAFARVASGNSGASMKGSINVAAVNPILNDKQCWSVEKAPSVSFMSAVRRVH